MKDCIQQGRSENEGLVQPLISIIVPVYNVEEYLDRCIDSLINQTFHRLEIILVDDGSTDDSAIICDKWKEKDKRITTIRKANGGQGSARNLGMRLSHGDYIGFVDSDDYIAPNLLESVVKAIDRYEPDMVMYNFQYFSDSGEVFPSRLRIENETVF